MLTGVVVKFDSQRCLIRRGDGGGEVLVDAERLRVAGGGRLAIGDRVEFLIEENRAGKMRAVDLRLISAAPSAARAA